MYIENAKLIQKYARLQYFAITNVGKLLDITVTVLMITFFLQLPQNQFVIIDSCHNNYTISDGKEETFITV